MKELSIQSLTNIHDLIHGQSYSHIKAQLDQLLPADYANTFLKIKIFGSNASWYGEDHISYKPYSEASQEEKEEIAIWLEDCKSEVTQTLEKQMRFINLLFKIPSKNEIFWYYNQNNQLRVALAQWGFEDKGSGKDVDIINMLISAPRTLVQQEVTIHIDYTDGEPAANIPFILNSFNNRIEVKTDANGDYYLGKIFANKTFSIESTNGKNFKEFTVVPNGEYKAVFDCYTDYVIVIEGEGRERKKNFQFKVNGIDVTTDKTGQYKQNVLLKGDDRLHVTVDGKDFDFELHRNPDENYFVISLEPEPKPEPEPEPEPPVPPVEKLVTFTLLDFDGTPLPNLRFYVMEKKRIVAEAMTDAQGKGRIKKELFDQKSKYKIKFTITKEYRKELDAKKKK